MTTPDSTTLAHLNVGQPKGDLVMDIYTYLSDNGANSTDAAHDAEWLAAEILGE